MPTCASSSGDPVRSGARCLDRTSSSSRARPDTFDTPFCAGCNGLRMATLERTFPLSRPRYTGLLEWITTTDHKKIGVLYLYTTFFFFLAGGLLALSVRTQLATPDTGLLTAEQYNAAFTMHGITMVFLAGGIVLYSAFIVGPPMTGWTMYVPLSTRQFMPTNGMDLVILGLTILGFSSIFGALNMIVTIFSLRAPGMTFHRITLFCWSVLVTSFLLVLAMPFLTVAGILLLFDRMAGTNFFAVGEGADPLLWQYLFWFFGHPEVYIMILPGFGVISEVLPVFSRKPIFGYRMIAYSSVAIGFLSFGVFVHHMFVAGIDPALQIFFMASTMLIAVPTGVKIFSWLGTIWGGALRFKTAMLFAMAFIVIFTIGGISGVFLGSVPVDVQLSDTYFVVAHIHYVLVQGALFCAFAAFYYWMPKMSGRLLSETLGRLHFFLFFIGVNMAFFPMHQLGLEGMPRRTFHYPQSPEWAGLNLVSTIGAYIIAAAILVFIWNYVYSILLGNGKPAGDDPWEADTLEWATTSPPQPYNFARIPVVHSARPLKEDVAH
ncbi:MAG: cytochrome ubiquinol oxidase subunit I [Chloroflexi bacterium]|nr:MAG: cytochrome ubiquinol oxidase subunit I [Chloroflexota bacterium]